MVEFHIIFWQNIISPHQSSFLRELANTLKTTLVVEQEKLEERIEMGWSVPDLGKTSILVNPKQSIINTLVIEDKEKKTHIFSNVYSKSIIKYAFNLSITNDCHIGLMAEPFNWRGITGIIRRIREKINYLRYGEKVEFFLAIGSKAVELYRKAGYKEKVFDWGYFIELTPERYLSQETNYSTTFTIVFVGRLINRKGIKHLVKVLVSIKDDYILKIVGNGPLYPKLVKMITNLGLGNKIIFLKNISNNEVREILKNCDLFILPSLRDGWGAVINEALMEGTPVICSNNCGGKVLLENSCRGIIFMAGNTKSLTESISTRIQKGKIRDNQRIEIKEWAMKNITGQAAANYLIDILDFVYNNAQTKPLPPWQSTI